jgi:neutral amino acid transport system permease protein
VHRRIMAAIGAVFFALIALFALAQPASADGEQVSGRLENRVDGGRTPVPGVTITVTGGGFTDSTTSGADGKWVIPVPAQGSYDVSIDLSTLPEGIGLTDPDKIVITTTVQPPNLNRIVIFPLGESTAVTNSKWATAAQLAFEGVRFGLLIALGALGLSLIYGTTGLTNFAHGEIITFGALATYTLNAGLGMPLLLAAILGVILTALFGAFQNRGLWKPLRKRGTGLIAMMIVSIGLAILLRNLFLFFYGGDKQAYTEFVGAAGLNFGPVSVTPADIVVIIVSILALGAVVVGVQKTRAGQGHAGGGRQPRPRLQRRASTSRSVIRWSSGSPAPPSPDSAACCSAFTQSGRLPDGLPGAPPGVRRPSRSAASARRTGARSLGSPRRRRSSSSSRTLVHAHRA